MGKIILARDEQGIIAEAGKLPWKQSADMKQLRELTTGHVLIMGRGTWESIGSKPLAYREHIVVSSAAGDFTGALKANTVMNANALAAELWPDKEVFFFGGPKVWLEAIFLGLVSKWHITTILRPHSTRILPPDALVFKDSPGRIFEKTHRHIFPADEKNEYPYIFEEWSSCLPPRN